MLVERQSEAVEAMLALAATTRSLLCCYTRELDPGLLDAPPVLEALRMLAVRERPLQSFPWNLRERGLALASQLQAFERLAGYRGAWYFHLIAGASVPAELAQHLLDDEQAGFHYLPDREAALLRRWVESPYSC